MANSTTSTFGTTMVLSEVHNFMRSQGAKHHQLLSVCNEVDGKVTVGNGPVLLDKRSLEAHIVPTYGIQYWRTLCSEVITTLHGDVPSNVKFTLCSTWKNRTL